MTVYADVLLIINLFVNYVLLLCSARIMKNPVSRFRVLLGAAVGSIYGLVIFLPVLPLPVEFAARPAAAALIVLCTFGYANLRKFLRCFFTFFSVSMIFGGIMQVLWLTAAPAGMIYSGGAVYFDIDIVVLAVSTVACFAVVSVISFFTERWAPKEHTATVTVSYAGKTEKLSALIDTGNSLREGFSGYPVAVAERSAVEKTIPKAVSDYLDGKSLCGGEPSFRMVVLGTVYGSGALPAFRPDSVEIRTVSKKIRTDRIYIAVTDKSLSKGEYGVILNPELISEEKNYAQNC